MRINAVTAQHDGYYQNDVSGEDIGGSESVPASRLAAALATIRSFQAQPARCVFVRRVRDSPADATRQQDRPRRTSSVAAARGWSYWGLPAHSAHRLLTRHTSFAPPSGHHKVTGNHNGQPQPVHRRGLTKEAPSTHCSCTRGLSGILAPPRLNAWLGSTSAETTQNMDVDYYGVPWAAGLPAGSNGVNEPLAGAIHLRSGNRCGSDQS